jgi:hypothetical protein
MFVYLFFNEFVNFHPFKLECQVDKKDHFRHLLLFAFNRDGKDAKAAQAAREICAVYGEDAMNERTAQRWFTRFKAGNFNLEDMARSGRPVEFDEDLLNELIREIHVNRPENWLRRWIVLIGSFVCTLDKWERFKN